MSFSFSSNSTYLREPEYITKVGRQLDKFKWINDRQAQARCPICGDSQKSKNKARFSFFRTDKGWRTHCYNCSYSNSFSYFLKENYNDLWLEMIVDNKPIKETKKHVELKNDVTLQALLDAKLLSTTFSDDAIRYIKSRQIPKLKQFFFTENFKSLALTIDPLKKEEQINDTGARLVFPLYDFTGRFVGVNARTIGNHPLRYITVKCDDTRERVFGIREVDRDETLIVLEGPIDACYIKNSIAMGSSLNHTVLKNFDKEKTIFALDNEPRNEQICNIMRKIARLDFRVCVWGSTEGKDVSEMICAGRSAHSVSNHILTHSYKGLEFDLNFTDWKK